MLDSHVIRDNTGGQWKLQTAFPNQKAGTWCDDIYAYSLVVILIYYYLLYSFYDRFTAIVLSCCVYAM